MEQLMKLYEVTFTWSVLGDTTGKECERLGEELEMKVVNVMRDLAEDNLPEGVSLEFQES